MKFEKKKQHIYNIYIYKEWTENFSLFMFRIFLFFFSFPRFSLDSHPPNSIFGPSFEYKNSILFEQFWRKRCLIEAIVHLFQASFTLAFIEFTINFSFLDLKADVSYMCSLYLPESIDILDQLIKILRCKLTVCTLFC